MPGKGPVALARRLRDVREDFQRDGPGSLLVRSLGVSERRWAGYEAGATVPGTVILRLIMLTGVSPKWLLNGDGPRYGPDGVRGADRRTEQSPVRLMDILDHRCPSRMKADPHQGEGS